MRLNGIEIRPRPCDGDLWINLDHEKVERNDYKQEENTQLSIKGKYSLCHFCQDIFISISLLLVTQFAQDSPN
jgi:hypothetical protein